MSKELKKILNTMIAIKEHCENSEGCDGCPFLILEENIVYGEKLKYCQLSKVGLELSYLPCSWDIEKIEDLMNR